jgi:hypothetical protein
VDAARGDPGTKLPAPLTRPAHWRRGQRRQAGPHVKADRRGGARRR